MSDRCPHSEFKDDRHDWTEAMLPKHKLGTGERLEVCYRCMAFRVRLVGQGHPIVWYRASGVLEREETTPSA